MMFLSHPTVLPGAQIPHVTVHFHCACILGSNLISQQSVTKRWQQPTTLNCAGINISLGAETAGGLNKPPYVQFGLLIQDAVVY